MVRKNFFIKFFPTPAGPRIVIFDQANYYLCANICICYGPCFLSNKEEKKNISMHVTYVSNDNVGVFSNAKVKKKSLAQ